MPTDLGRCAPLLHCFTKPNSVMRILTFFSALCSLFFFACQQNQLKLHPQEANLGTSTSCQQAPEKAPPSAANVIFQSSDGGQTWQDISAGLPEKSEPGGVSTDRGEVFVNYDSKLYRSNSGAATPAWQQDFLLEERIGGISPGKTGAYVGVYLSGFYQNIPRTGIWKPVYATLKDNTVRSILETQDGNIFIGSDKGIFKSADGGKTWKQVYEGDMVLSLTAVDGTLIGAGDGVLRSTDGGEHWEVALKSDGVVLKTTLIENRLVAMNRIKRGEGPWQTAANRDGMMTTLSSSVDGGKTWQRLDENLPPVRDIYDIEKAGDHLFCSCDTGVYRSSDWGKTWELVLPSDGEKPLQLAVSGKVVYVVKTFSGC